MNASPCLARMMPLALTALGSLPASACQVGSLTITDPLLENNSASLGWSKVEEKSVQREMFELL